MLLFYYISPGPGEVTAFQPVSPRFPGTEVDCCSPFCSKGFRMFVGDVLRREPLYKSQSCFCCFNGPDFGGDDMAPCSDPTLDH